MFFTAGNVNIVRDVTKNATKLFHASLVVQIPGIDRTTETLKMSMQWPKSPCSHDNDSIYVLFRE